MPDAQNITCMQHLSTQHACNTHPSTHNFWATSKPIPAQIFQLATHTTICLCLFDGTVRHAATAKFKVVLKKWRRRANPRQHLVAPWAITINQAWPQDC